MLLLLTRLLLLLLLLTRLLLLLLLLLLTRLLLLLLLLLAHLRCRAHRHLILCAIGVCVAAVAVVAGTDVAVARLCGVSITGGAHS